MKQLMKNKLTGEIVEFKGCLYNNSSCIIIYNDNEFMHYPNLDMFRKEWMKYEGDN